MTAPDIQQEIERTQDHLGETVDELAARADVKARARARAAIIKDKAAEMSGQLRQSQLAQGDAVRRRWPLVAAAAGAQLTPVSLELGGKNPNVIFADADLDDAIATSIQSSFANQGEICLCGSRIFVERAIYSEFVDRFVAATKKLRIGDPSDASTDVGALISEAHLQKVTGYLALAKEEGGSVVTGGSRVNRSGYFLEPAVITGLGTDCRWAEPCPDNPDVYPSTRTPRSPRRRCVAAQ